GWLPPSNTRLQTPTFGFRRRFSVGSVPMLITSPPQLTLAMSYVDPVGSCIAWLLSPASFFSWAC
ncbi:MAG TPA: hypothetical protein VGW32_09390, partial [Pyrinomonadaceae bacterium]|nr:hypothetical protein [Pyrinomonadaceae bacterium]